MPILLQINITANWGSTGKIAESIGLAAIKQGWESYIAYGRWSNPSQSNLIKVGNKLDMFIHYSQQRIFDNEGLCSSSPTRQLIKLIKEIKPNLVHLHNLHDHYLNYRLLFEFLNQTGIKVVWTFHDFWAVTGHCVHFVSIDCNRYQTGCYDCPMRNVYPKTLFDRSKKNWKLKKHLFLANNSLTIVPVSEWVGEQVRKSFLKNKRIQVIPNGIDTGVFKPTSFSDISNLSSQLLFFQTKTSGKFVIMSVASQWKFEKGLDDYKAMSAILKEDEVIVLVGVDDDVIAELPSNIIGIKRTTKARELAALYTRADVITILSSAETFGLTVVEGYACGTPAVVYNNTALPLLIESGTGYVVENKNYQDAYSAIQQIKKKGKQYYTDNCIRVAKEKYNKDECFKNYLNLYEQLINE